MMTCREASLLASRSLDETLPLSDRIALRLHLAICRSCSNHLKAIRVLHNALHKGVDLWEELEAYADASLSPTDRETMRARVQEAAGA